MGVYINRILNMKKIKAIGFDMDHTIVRYNTELDCFYVSLFYKHSSSVAFCCGFGFGLYLPFYEAYHSFSASRAGYGVCLGSTYGLYGTRKELVYELLVIIFRNGFLGGSLWYVLCYGR